MIRYLQYCRICRSEITKDPSYYGYIEKAVCSTLCMGEWDWRKTLSIMNKQYYERQTSEKESE